MGKKSLDTSFENWIKTGGYHKIGKTLRVHEMTVRQWHDGKSLPTARLMKKIKKVTRGRIGYKEIIEGSCSPIK